ncbi:MAG: transglutaminase domain-containing protein [Chloroflexi bacterium]|nr:transglutaminase domain-containing protein [Chloroflexota bacterium]
MAINNQQISPDNQKSSPRRKLDFGRLLWLTNIILASLTLGIAIRSIEAAEWTTPQPAFTLVFAMAILAALALVKSRLPTQLANLVCIALGVLITFWQVSGLLQTTSARLLNLELVLQALMTRPAFGANHNTLQFAAFLTFYTWMAGYISTWLVLRRQNVWFAIMLGAITIVVNLSQLTNEYFYFLYWFLLAALVLLGQARLLREHLLFRMPHLHLPPRSILYSLTISVCLALLVVPLTWFIPAVRVQRLETLTSSMPLRKNIESYFENILSTVPAKSATPAPAASSSTGTAPARTSLFASEQAHLHMGDTWDDTEDVHFVVTSPQPSYWRTRSYDFYATANGWTSSPGSAGNVNPPSLENEAELPSPGTLTYSVLTSLETDVFLSAGEPLLSDTSTLTETLTPKDFVINLADSSRDRFLPADVAAVARSLREAQKTTRPLLRNEISPLLPPDLMLKTAGQRERSQSTQIVLSRKPTAENSVMISLPTPVRPEQRYTVLSQIISATPDELSQAGIDYPNWVKDFYLQLPANFPGRVKELAQDVIQDAETPYAKAEAIREYLFESYSYSLFIQAPPQGVDGVEYFLFEQKSGFCVYFASAMTTMLRSVNVPARLAAGYNPGEPDVKQGTFILRGKNSHAWTEVYFPGYGWVVFDATPPARSSGSYYEEEEPLDEPIFSIDYTPLNASSSISGWKVLGFLLFVPGVLVLLTVARRIYRGRLRFPGRDYSFEVYARLCSWASLVGLGPRLQQTPAEFGNSLSTALPKQAGAIQSIIQTYLESRYSPRRYSGWQKQKELQKSWGTLHRALLKQWLLKGKRRP